MTSYDFWQQFDRDFERLIHSLYHSEITGDLLGIRRS